MEEETITGPSYRGNQIPDRDRKGRGHTIKCVQVCGFTPGLYKVGTGGHPWEWDGVQEDSEVAMIEQGSYPFRVHWLRLSVKDHRTEGELHINKRDKELFELEEDSYGKAQADATLEGAVYGLYAAEDIRYPDGKTGVVFSAGSWYPLPQRIKW